MVGNSLWGIKERYRGETPQMGQDSLPCHCQAEGGDLGLEEEWRQVPARHRRQCHPIQAPLSQVPFHNRFEALELEGPVAEEEVESVARRMLRMRKSTLRLRTACIRTEKREIVVGDSLLRGTEGTICRPDPTHKEVCCLPGTRVRDIARKLPRLVWPSDCYTLLIVQAGSDDIEERSLKAMKQGIRGLGRLVDGAGVQVVQISMLQPVEESPVQEVEGAWRRLQPMEIPTKPGPGQQLQPMERSPHRIRRSGGSCHLWGTQIGTICS